MMKTDSVKILGSHWYAFIVLISLVDFEVLAFNYDRINNVNDYSIPRLEKMDYFQLCGQLNDLSTPVRKPKQKTINKRKKKKNAGKVKKNTKEAVTAEELHHHLSTRYAYNDRIGNFRSEGGSLTEKHNKQLKFLDRHKTLVLNADYKPMSYLPLSMWHWQETVKSVFSGKVTVVDTYPNIFVRAANLEIALPSVIALNDYIAMPNSKPAFTRRNVLLRDEFRCQYCGGRFLPNSLSLDHVMPRSLGGRLNWENAVTSCTKCNGRKGCLTLNQLSTVGMKLRKKPVAPTQHQLHMIAGKMLPRKVHPTWHPYLGYTSEFSSEESKST